MIWVWIGLSVAVSLLLLRGKGIAPYNLFWLLVPINRYGLDIFGFTLKPVYIYSVLFVIFAILCGKFRVRFTKQGIISSLFFAVLIVLSMAFRSNSAAISDMRVYCLLLLCSLCSVFMLSFASTRDDLRQISDVIIATAVGYGIIMIALTALYNLGIELPGVFDSYNNPSVLCRFSGVSNGMAVSSIRLRGFSIDPNAWNVIYIASLAFLFGKWIKNGGMFRNIIYSIVIISCIALTHSRSGIIITLFIILLSIIRLLSSHVKLSRKLIFVAGTSIAVFTLLILFIYNVSFIDRFFSAVVTNYANRSRMTDPHGRVTIWINAIKLMFSRNWLFGIGSRTLIEVNGNEAHNTVLEVFCSSGILVGIYYLIYFLSPFISIVKFSFKNRESADICLDLIIAFMGIFSMYMTITDIASTELIYMTFLIKRAVEILSQNEYSPVDEFSGNAVSPRALRNKSSTKI